MTKPVNSVKNLDDALVDFTNQSLDKNVPTEPMLDSSNEELHTLEETVMMLNRAFPRQSLSEQTIKRMQADFKVRKAKIDYTPRKVFWKSQQTVQRFGLALAVIVILSILLVASFITGGSNSVQASAGLHPQSIGLLVLAGGILFLAIWIGIRK